MDNFRVFNFDQIKPRIDAFAPGMAQAITPIKYEAITPDIFCFLFRTTGQGNQDYFFVLFSYDYVSSSDDVVQLIESWHGGKIVNFWEPAEGQKHVDSTDEQIKKFAVDYNSTYHSLLAMVDRPAGKGYWATNIVVLPGDDIDAKLADLSDSDRQSAKVALAKVIERAGRASHGKSTLDDFKKRIQAVDPDTLTTNSTDLAISLFKNHRDGWEFFYNPVREPDNK